MLGYTSNLLPHERQAWSDEHLNQVPEKDSFPLPETDFATTQWRWVADSEWKVDPSWSEDHGSGKSSRDKDGWTYYDNAWQGGSKTDDWGKWTRRRRWIRDAELVELTPEELAAQQQAAATEADVQSITTNNDWQDGDSITTAVKKKGWFGKRRLTNETKSKADNKAEVSSMSGSADTGQSSRSRDDAEDDMHTPYRYKESQWLDRSFGDGLAEGLS